MKIDDVVVGEEYAVKGNWGGVRRVVAVAIEKVSFTRGLNTSQRRQVIVEPRDGDKAPITSSAWAPGRFDNIVDATRLIRPWAEQGEIVRKREEIEMERGKLRARLERLLERAGIEETHLLTTVHHDRRVSVNVRLFAEDIDNLEEALR